MEISAKLVGGEGEIIGETGMEMQKDPRHNDNSSFMYNDFEIADESLHSPSRIPLEKWQEILEEERDSHVIGSIREEIVQSAVDAIYEGYLRKVVYGFVISRQYENWIDALQVISRKQRRTHRGNTDSRN